MPEVGSLGPLVVPFPLFGEITALLSAEAAPPVPNNGPLGLRLLTSMRPLCFHGNHSHCRAVPSILHTPVGAADERMHKTYASDTHTTDYYSALKRKEILPHTMTRTKPEDMLSETRQPQEDEF